MSVDASKAFDAENRAKAKDSKTTAAKERGGVFRTWKEDIGCVFQRDPAARGWLEVATTYPGVHAVLGYRATHWLWQRGWRYPAKVLSMLIRQITQVEIHPGAKIGRRFFIDHGAGVVIGETAEVGDDCTLYHGVTLGGVSWSQGKRHPTLGSGVVVGAGAKVLGPINIGDRAKIGANSVVVKDVPGGKTVVGIPGKVVRSRKESSSNPYGVDLDHHLIPDPVANAIGCLIDRIQHLEAQAGVAYCDQCGASKGEQSSCEDECFPIKDSCGTGPIRPETVQKKGDVCGSSRL